MEQKFNYMTVMPVMPKDLFKRTKLKIQFFITLIINYEKLKISIYFTLLY